jgi:ABC-type Na+ efflux pump permease subunit
MKNLSLFVGKIRPQIFLALLILGVVAMYGMRAGLNEVTVGCIAGIIALAKDVLAVDNSDGEGGGD